MHRSRCLESSRSESSIVCSAFPLCLFFPSAQKATPEYMLSNFDWFGHSFHRLRCLLLWLRVVCLFKSSGDPPCDGPVSMCF